ncbi:hypothetical protein INE90_01123 [Bacteroides uniformis]|nr:hypothetical protein [Phocaeicola vulgatus]MBT0708795.1 hypothetical protein [Phocaeicola vulgatus]QUT34378.1 hypothetical protein INE90_01123 [Bacteroides uniformis]
MKKNLAKQITATRETREFLAKNFHVSKVTVWQALTFKKDNDLMRRIRMAAKERGGVTLISLPELETFHDCDGFMRQYLPNGVLLEFDRRTNGCDVFHRGRNVRHYDNVMLSDIDGIQNWAMALK